MNSDTALFELPAHPDELPDPNSPFHSECLTSALELLEVLKTEAQILKRFAGAELMALVPKKEYLVNELKWKLESARKTGTDNSVNSESFRALLCEIETLNQSNAVFIEKSLSYWQDLMSVFSPPSYGPTGDFIRHVPNSPRGTAFRREI